MFLNFHMFKNEVFNCVRFILRSAPILTCRYVINIGVIHQFLVFDTRSILTKSKLSVICTVKC